jgi:hypothetical protein
MVTNMVSIIHEQEAMLGQLEFLNKLVTNCKEPTLPKAINKNDIPQLILMVYYLKEGIEDLYTREDNYVLSKIELLDSGEIKYKHKEVIDSLHMIYRLLINLNSTTPVTEKYLSSIIKQLYNLVSNISIQEIEIFQSYNN